MELLRFEMLLPGFALVLARMAGLMLAAPLFSSSQIPLNVKVWLTVALGLLVYPIVMPTLPSSLSMGQAAAGCVGEFILGEIIGLGVGLVFFAAQMAGSLLSHQAGLTLGETFNPVFDSETTVLDQLLFFTALMFFFVLRGHLAVVQLLLDSFRHVPPMSMLTGEVELTQFTAMLQSLMEASLRLAGPVVLALLMALLALGVLSRTIPQFNLLSVGLPLKIGVAFVVLAVTLTSAGDLFADTLWDGLDHVADVLDQASKRVMHAGR
jgi:flagellar biosynthetic protein FliR